MGEGLLAWCGLRHLHRRPERPSCLTVMPPDRDWTSGLACCVVEDGWPLRRAAERFQVSPTTAQRWADRYWLSGEASMADRPAVRTPAHAGPRRGPNDGSSRSGSCDGGALPASPTCSALTAALKRAVRAVSGGARRGSRGCAASEQALRALCVVRGDRGSVDGRTEFREPGASTSVKRPAASRNVSCAAMMPRTGRHPEATAK